MNLLTRLREYLGRPADGASVAVFRIAFGALMLWEVGRYFQYDWIWSYWIEPPFHFTYPGFSWVQPWPGDGMYIHFAVLGASAAAIMIGLLTRAAAAIFFVAFTYMFLLDKARYLNHFYLISLLGLLLAFIPANRVWSLDRVLSRRTGAEWPPTVPMWAVWILRFQMGVVYAFAGIAKLDAGWLSGQVFQTRFETTGGAIAGWIVDHGLVTIAAWGGLLFDLLIVPLLLWRRTRLVGFVAVVVFHLSNAELFSIGVFPWLGIAATTLFFSPDWPRRLAGRNAPSRITQARAGDRVTASPSPVRQLTRPAIALLTAYVAVQLLVPFRHHLYPGDVDWNWRGHRFSWRMKLHAVQGDVRLRVVAGGDTTVVVPSRHMPEFQDRTMVRYPDMILQFAHWVADRYRDRLGSPVEVYADAVLSVDGRPASRLIDPTVDLASQRKTFGAQPWILDEGRLPHR